MNEMRLPHILFALLMLSACTTRITRDPVIQPDPVIEPKPVAPGTPLIGEITLNAASKINGTAQPAFPNRPGEAWLLIRQIYDANANGIPEPDEHTVPRWAVRVMPVNDKNVPTGKSRLFFTPENTDFDSGIFVNIPIGRYKIQFVNPFETVTGPDLYWRLTPSVGASNTDIAVDLQPTSRTEPMAKIITNLAFCASGNAANLQIEPFSSGPFGTWKCRQQYRSEAFAPQGNLVTSPRNNVWAGIITRPYEPITLSWETDSDTQATIDHGIGEVQNNVMVQPSFITKYTLSLKNEFGSTKQSVTVIPSATSRLNPDYGKGSILEFFNDFQIKLGGI
jgi:hypothetical protein